MATSPFSKLLGYEPNKKPKPEGKFPPPPQVNILGALMQKCDPPQDLNATATVQVKARAQHAFILKQKNLFNTL